MPKPVPRIGRALDAAGLLLFLVGAALYGRAWLGLRHLRETQPVVENAREMAAMSRFIHFWELSRWGMWIMAAGAVVAVIAAVVARRRSG